MFRFNTFLMVSLLSVSSFADDGTLSCVKGRFEITETKDELRETRISGVRPWYNFFLKYDAQEKRAVLESKLMNPADETILEFDNQKQSAKIGDSFKAAINTILFASESGLRCPCVNFRNQNNQESVDIFATGTLREVWNIEHLVYMKSRTWTSDVEGTDCSEQNKAEWLKDQNKNL